MLMTVVMTTTMEKITERTATMEKIINRTVMPRSIFHLKVRSSHEKKLLIKMVNGLDLTVM